MLRKQKKAEFEDHIFICKIEINISNMESSLIKSKKADKEISTVIRKD